MLKVERRNGENISELVRRFSEKTSAHMRRVEESMTFTKPSKERRERRNSKRDKLKRIYSDDDRREEH